jgi:hypothetical protein
MLLNLQAVENYGKSVGRRDRNLLLSFRCCERKEVIRWKNCASGVIKKLLILP